MPSGIGTWIWMLRGRGRVCGGQGPWGSGRREHERELGALLLAVVAPAVGAEYRVEVMDGAWVGLQQEGHVQHDVRLERENGIPSSMYCLRMAWSIMKNARVDARPRKRSMNWAYQSRSAAAPG